MTDIDQLKVYLSVERGKIFTNNETGMLLHEVAFYLSPENAGGNPHDKTYWSGGIGFNYSRLHNGRFMRPLQKTLKGWGRKPTKVPYELPSGSKWRVEILWAMPTGESHHDVQILTVR